MNKFMQTTTQPTTGGTAVAVSAKPTNIRAGSLYGYHGTIVRANQLAPNGKRHVSFHKQLHGFVSDGELQPVSMFKKLKYLLN
jgi:hypothetical protein